MDYITIDEAGRRLGVSRNRIRWLLLEKKIDGQRVGRGWAIDPASVESRRQLMARRTSMPPQTTT